MRIVRTLALLALPLLLGSACSTQHKFYEGPKRPDSKLARIECFRYGEELELLAVDGAETPQSHILVLPGSHELTLRGPRNISAETDPEMLSGRELERPIVTVKIDVEAGSRYYLGVSLKDLAFSRARYSGTHYWQEGFYRTWSVDVFGKSLDDPLPPELIRSFEFRAE